MTNWPAICRNSSEATLLNILGSTTFHQDAVYSAHAELIRREEERLAISPCPNLDKWKNEMASGLRTAADTDELWRLACKEATEIEIRAALHRRPSLNDLPYLE